MKADAQALKGHLDTLLLASLEGGTRHGYAVKEALRQRGGDKFDIDGYALELVALFDRATRP